MVQFDMPAIINGVLAKTGMQKVLFVGHSQGSIQLLLAMKEHPDLSSKVGCFIGMGTVLSM
jgi:triacylglycerol esterase/lipase EstA (alpha/beta hydrolase family)